ncbi:MAG: hypothetical protein GY781_17645 [Gammaproteobacteria bacterium]|nr:hypothetical protein [Gammaproteobacteria bacterium]
MADFLGDVIRVFLDTKEQFTGEALKLKQVGVCRNVGLSKGHEFVARDHDGLYYTVESAQVQSNWTATDTGSPSYILNKPMTFFVSTGSELAAALSSNIANKTIICSNNTLPSIRESLVIPTNTPVKGDNYIYGCRVAF